MIFYDRRQFNENNINIMRLVNSKQNKKKKTREKQHNSAFSSVVLKCVCVCLVFSAFTHHSGQASEKDLIKVYNVRGFRTERLPTWHTSFKPCPLSWQFWAGISMSVNLLKLKTISNSLDVGNEKIIIDPVKNVHGKQHIETIIVNRDNRIYVSDCWETSFFF